MKKKQLAAMALAAVMLTGSASALFGSKKEAAEPVAGAPTVQDLEISTYRDIPYQTQFLLASSEGDVTYAVAEEPKKGTVTISGSEFTYTPEEGVTGSDSFTYTATDSQGRVSQPATVQVRIEKSKDDEIGQLCEAINDMASELGATERMKNDFISSVSHELR